MSGVTPKEYDSWKDLIGRVNAGNILSSLNKLESFDFEDEVRQLANSPLGALVRSGEYLKNDEKDWMAFCACQALIATDINQLDLEILTNAIQWLKDNNLNNVAKSLEMTQLYLQNPQELIAKLSDTNYKKQYVNLSGGDLTGCDLRSANVVMLNLQNANLSGLDLHGKDFREANLAGAKFVGTNLSGANMSGANLTNANLTNADFSDVNFQNTKIEGARFVQTEKKSGPTNKENITGSPEKKKANLFYTALNKFGLHGARKKSPTSASPKNTADNKPKPGH